MIRWRLALGVCVGAAAYFLALSLGAPPPARGLIGWNVGVAVYLAVVWTLFLTASEADVRARAALQDERRWVILALVLCAICASVAAIVLALLDAKVLARGVRGLVLALAAVTLASTWALLQTVFTLHYAHEHFRVVRQKGEGAGIVFPGEPARTYLDFVYLAVCVGATGQVSDPNVTSTRLRNLVTIHGAIAFFYNTAVLALGIDILAGLLGG